MGGRFPRYASLLLALALAGLGEGQAVADGVVATWGYNNNGQLGNANTGTNSNVPVSVNATGVLAGKTVTQISEGTNTTCAVTSDGGAYCWGANVYGQLGNGVFGASSNVPVAVSTSGALAGKTVTQISTGGNTTCAVTSDGGAYCWGYNNNGQMGNGNTGSSSNAPVAVSMSGVLAGKTVTQISTAAFTTCAVTSDGGAYCWGLNNYGQLGNGDTTNSNVPVAVSTSGVLAGKTVTQITTVINTTCAVTSDGGAYCWGLNHYGQLGNGDTTNSSVPVAVSGVLSTKTVKQIATGGYTSCAVTSDGGAYCWGYNNYGQQGNGSTTDSNAPVAVSGVLSGKTVTQIATANSTTCAVTSDGGAYCWGYNNYGQQGNGNTGTNSSVPVAVTSGSGPLQNAFVSQITVSNGTAAAVAPAGGPGRAIAAGSSAPWQQMGTVCTPTGSATVADLFGDGSPMNLTTADYNVPDPAASKGWVVWRYNPTGNQYVRLAATDTISLGAGYWLRSYQPARQGKLFMTCPNTAPSAPVTQADGCASANGCVAIPLTSVAGVDRSNLIGNPFPYAVDWSQVRVRIDGAGSYTPSQAAGLDASGNASPPVISNVFSVWNGTSYASYSDSGVTAGQLPYFSSFWVKVLSGSFGHTVELLIPNLPTQTARPF